MYRGVTGLCLATVLFVCSALGFPIAPADQPAADGALVLGSGTTAHVSPGGRVTVSGTCFAPDANVTFALYPGGQEVGTATASEEGTVTASVAVPSGLSTASTLVALGNAPDGGSCVLEGSLTPVVATSGGAPAALARTGASILLLTLGGVVLLLSGLVLVRTAVLRRRLLPAP